MASLNILAIGVLLVVLFIMVNYISSRRYVRWDLTRTKITALSDQTRQVLKTLKAPVSVIVFYQPSHRLYELLKDELAEYQRLSPQVHVEYVDPEQDVAKAKQLAQELQIDKLNLVVFKTGARHKYLSDEELAEFEPAANPFGGERRIRAFNAEAAFTSTILNLTQGESPLAWATSGHGEPSLDEADERGASDFKRLLEQENVSLKTVTLLEQPAIPKPVRLMLIIGPTRRFHEREIGLLQTFLEQGGACLALLDPLTDTGLDGWLERWGVSLGLDVVVDPERQLPFVSASNLLVTSYSTHPLVRNLRTLLTLFPLARSVQPARPAPPGLTVTSLAQTSPAGWGETQTSVPKFQFNEGADLKGPVSIAVAVERAVPPQIGEAASGVARMRLVVIGDSDFAGNTQLGNVGNKDFALAAVQWLLEQEHRIGIGPKTLESVRLHMTGGQLNGLFWMSLLAMPLGLAALGALVWWQRRR